MRIYYADIREIDEARAAYPPMSERHGSAFGTSLLAAAYEDYAGSALPLITRIFGKKPFFSKDNGLHFSISHSRSHVLCALSENPVGADTIDHRKMRRETIVGLATARELEDFSFYELWALRESFYKLTGEGDLRTMRFLKENNTVKGPRPDVYSRLYLDIEDSSTAISAYNDDFPDHIIRMPIEKLLKSQGLLSR